MSDSAIQKLQESVEEVVRGWLAKRLCYPNCDGKRLVVKLSDDICLEVCAYVFALYIDDGCRGTGQPTAEIDTSLSLHSERVAALRGVAGLDSDDRAWASGLATVAASPSSWKFTLRESGEVAASDRTERYVSTVEGAVNRLRHEISDLDDISALYLANSDQAWRFNGLHCLAVTGLAGEVDAGYRLFEKLCLSGPLSDEGRADLADDGAKLLQALDRRELGRQLIESVAEQARRKREGEAQREVERRERIAANAERDRTRVIKPLTVKKEFRRPGRSGE